MCRRVAVLAPGRRSPGRCRRSRRRAGVVRPGRRTQTAARHARWTIDSRVRAPSSPSDPLHRGASGARRDGTGLRSDRLTWPAAAPAKSPLRLGRLLCALKRTEAPSGVWPPRRAHSRAGPARPPPPRRPPARRRRPGAARAAALAATSATRAARRLRPGATYRRIRRERRRPAPAGCARAAEKLKRSAPSLGGASRATISAYRAVSDRHRQQRRALAIGAPFMPGVARSSSATLDLTGAGVVMTPGLGQPGDPRRVQRAVVGDQGTPRRGRGPSAARSATHARRNRHRTSSASASGAGAAGSAAAGGSARRSARTRDRPSPASAVRRRSLCARSSGVDSSGVMTVETTVATRRHVGSRSIPSSATRRTSGSVARLRSNSAGV